MYKKFVFPSVVGALMLSASGQVFAMEEEKDEYPSAQLTVPLSSEASIDVEDGTSLPSEIDKPLAGSDLVDSIYEACKSTQRIEKVFAGGKANAQKKEELLDKLKRAISIHIDYGFKIDFIKYLFDSNRFWFGGGENYFGYNSSKCFPLEILSLKIEEVTLNTQTRDFRGKLAEFYEKCDCLENQKGEVTYGKHFGTFFRFIEGMSEEQQASTISLLSPHLNRKNFGNFYPYQLLEGLDNYGVGDLNGVRKIEWLQKKLEGAGYFPE